MAETDKKALMEEFERKWKELMGTPTPEYKPQFNSRMIEDASMESEIYSGWDKYLGSNFDAHGITKGFLSDQKKSLLDLLDNGISDRTYTAPFCFTPEEAPMLGPAYGVAGGAYKTGLAIIVSDYKKSLEDGIKLVLLTDLAETLIPTLQKMYPDVMFSRLSDAQQAFETLYEKATGEKYKSQESSGTMKDTLTSLKVEDQDSQVDKRVFAKAASNALKQK